MIERQVAIRVERIDVTGDTLPIAWQAVAGADAPLDDLCAWLAERKPEIERVLASSGALLLRGFAALDSAAAFERALSALFPHLMDYVGGTSPRRQVRGNIMTATEVPPTYSIPLHQEMSYTDTYPDRIAFFCELPPGGGGATTLGDMRAITARIDPAVRERWRAGGVQLRRTLPSDEKAARKPGVSKPWSEVFGTADRAEVERIASGRGWRADWLPDGSVQLWQELRPALRTYEKTGDEVWFNQAHIFAPATTLRWTREDGREEQYQRLKAALDEHPEMIDRVFHRGEREIDADDVMHVYDVLKRSEIPLRWERGDLLFLDNTLAGHGRTSFSGERKVLTALIRD